MTAYRYIPVLMDPKSINAAFDRKTVERLQDIEKLDIGEREHVFALLDAFLAKSKLQAILK